LRREEMSPFRIRPPSRLKGVAAGGGDDFRPYLDRLLKMIPGEVVGLYLVGGGFIPENAPTVLTVWTLICVIGVIAIRAYGTTDPAEAKPPQWPAVIIATVAFAIWVYTLGGPFKAYNLHVPYIGSLLVLAWTFFVPIVYRGS